MNLFVFLIKSEYSFNPDAPLKNLCIGYGSYEPTSSIHRNMPCATYQHGYFPGCRYVPDMYGAH
jgi:hypothetical protein